MPVPFAAVAPIIGAGISAIGSLFGGASSAEANRRAQQEAQNHQIRMRATQYQATVKDMKQAGLNPIMLAQGSALSQGMGAGMAPAGQVGEGISKASGKFTDALLMRAQLENTASSSQLNRELAAKAIQEAANIQTDTYNKGYQGDLLRIQSEMGARMADANLTKLVNDGVLSQANADAIRADMGLNVDRSAQMRASAAASNAAAAVDRERLPGLAWESSAMGIGLKELRATIASGAQAVGSIKGGLGSQEVRQDYKRKGGGPPPRRPEGRNQ